MKIYDKASEKVVKEILTNNIGNLDEAIRFCGKFIDGADFDEPNVIIDGKEYYYDDLEVVTVDSIADEAINTMSGWQEERQKEAIDYASSYVNDWYAEKYNLTDDEIQEIASQIEYYFND